MNNNHNNKFFDGFLWGAIIGGGLVFILGTKKGKKILKMITEEGVEGLSEILEAQMDKDEEDLEDEEASGIDEVVEEPKITNGNGVSRDDSQTPPIQAKPAASGIRKRFFRKKSS